MSKDIRTWYERVPVGMAAVHKSTLLGKAVFCLGLILALATPAWPQGSVGTFTTFDAPGAGTGGFLGTAGVSINAAGVITGFYLASPNVAHGFVRAIDGTITTFDAPNAGTGSTQGTFPLGINTAEEIAGMYFDAGNVSHGFVRAPGGTITEFDVTGAGTDGHRGTEPMSIDTAGNVAGIYTDNSALRHGFVRAANGTITTFDVTGAGTTGSTQGQGTQPLSISGGNITGFYVDANGGFHGFIRAANGTITAPIDVPGAGTSGGTEHHMNIVGTMPIRIDAAGDITGIYTDANHVGHAFLRAAGGTITYPIDAPGVSTTGGPIFLPTTLAASINSAGFIAGTYEDTHGVFHAFLRSPDGTMTAPIDDPNASGAGASFLPGTFSVSINDSATMTGAYFDASGLVHGFLLATTPQGQVASLQGAVESLVSARTINPAVSQFLLTPLDEALAALGPLASSANRRIIAAPASMDDAKGSVAERAGQYRGRTGTTAAIRDLEEFIGRVRLLELIRRLNNKEARTLIEAAESIINTLHGED